MNLILFEPEEITRPLPLGDPRAVHLQQVLRRGSGEPFDVGVVNGARGKARIVGADLSGLSLAFEWGAQPGPLDPIELLLAIPRPQTARKILGEATALGVRALRFFVSEKGEKAYAKSSLWTSAEWLRHLKDGAAQAFDTRIPEVHHHPDLAQAVAALPPGLRRLAMDNYEASRRHVPEKPLAPAVLALGPERGWSAAERNLLRSAGFELVHMGERVLRTETALVAAVSIHKAVT